MTAFPESLVTVLSRRPEISPCSLSNFLALPPPPVPPPPRLYSTIWFRGGPEFLFFMVLFGPVFFLGCPNRPSSPNTLVFMIGSFDELPCSLNVVASVGGATLYHIFLLLSFLLFLSCPPRRSPSPASKAASSSFRCP